MSWTTERLTRLMEDAVAFSAAHVRSGGLPFVGLVVADDGYVSDYGVNQVHATGDPSAHAEIVAMRATLRHRGLADLNGMSLLATGEPCGLCYQFALEHRIGRIYVAVDSDTVAGWGFDYRRSYPALGIDRAHLADIVTALPVSSGLEPFERYFDQHSLDRHLRA